ncbi:hypothetical protein [Blastococcus brunescens]|uniref:Hemagglutinin n=1 Tax=Blastococcus brunescens TaxID=1564165 RepID=A0ABZ1AWP6_9ACTN|nr:hypothetical protein [Blastococcus sp. BMG 8361]WRL62930.1 hypothetical protein U6N30_24170 [Blastococcus sp. BMG 8361]
MALMAGALMLGVGGEPRATAALAADFDPGNLISDSVFFNPTTMTAHEVQSFLSNRGAACVAGEQACLKDYTTTTGARVPDGLCQGYQGGLVQSAAQIIAGTAHSCGINPQVLLVLLEKEQRLVTRTKPTNTNYRSAVGFGCPDTAACDAQYYGFFNQVYSAARRFQDYAARPGSFRHKAGQVAQVYWHEDLDRCGSGPVLIANQATAGLYNYTPYQPNAASLNNLYGTGDSCSSYGNRNFWRMFTDWFGDPRAGSHLVRTAQDPSVYVVSGANKHLIPDYGTLEAVAPLGSVGFVSQQYLDRRTTGPRMSRVVHAPTGGVFFLDAGMKLQFPSCGQVADYGGSCDSLVRLEQPLIDAFHTGPMMTSLYRTTTGKAFFVQGGVKREAVDDAALVAAGMPTVGVTLLEAGVAHVPYGVPVTRPGVALRNRSTGGMTLSVGSDFVSVAEPVRVVSALRGLPVRLLDDVSLRQLPRVGVPGAIVREAGGSGVFLLTEAGKWHLTDPAMLPAAPPEMPASVLGYFPDAGTFSGAGFVKGSASGTVYVLREGKRRSVSSWPDLVALNGGDPAPSFLTIDQRVADLLPAGPAQLGPGALVFSPRSPTVFFVNGRSELIPVGSFSTTLELGATRLVQVGDVDVAAYTVRNSGIGTAIDCGGTRYLGLGGKLYRVGTDAAAHYTLYDTAVDPAACAALPKAAIDLTRFLRAADGTIFYMENGLKRPIRSIEAWVALGGTSANTIQATGFALGLLPTGTPW